MKISDLGILLEKFNHSGINNHPVISDNELNKLARLIENQIDISVDFKDTPNVEFWTYRHESVKKVIAARKDS